MKMIRITAKRDGFRRAGIAHGKAPTDYPAEAFTADQLEQLRSDPMLTVEDVEMSAPAPAPRETGADAAEAPAESAEPAPAAEPATAAKPAKKKGK